MPRYPFRCTCSFNMHKHMQCTTNILASNAITDKAFLKTERTGGIAEVGWIGVVAPRSYTTLSHRLLLHDAGGLYGCTRYE